MKVISSRVGEYPVLIISYIFRINSTYLLILQIIALGILCYFFSLILTGELGKEQKRRKIDSQTASEEQT